MTAARVMISIGSSTGYAARMVHSAFKTLRTKIPGVEVVATSAMYESKPCDNENHDSIHGAIELRTTVEPSKLLNILKDIEVEVGSVECCTRNGSRPLDLDILMYGNSVVDFPEERRGGKVLRRALKIPHYKMLEREFVLYPLLDIDPDLRHPIIGKTVEKMLFDLKRQKDESPSNLNLGSSVVRRVCPLWGLGEQSKGKPLWRVDTSDPLIMGILNVTSDSFSHPIILEGSQGRHNNPQPEDLQRRRQNCIDEAFRMKSAGVDIIDVGGESTRPGAEPTPVEAQLANVIPVIRSLTNAGIGVPISIDTRSAIVARQALNVGATIINDISAGRRDPDILDVAANENVTFMAIHGRGAPKTMLEPQYYKYEDPVKEVCEELGQSCLLLQRRGVAKWMHIVDPGFGFAKLKHTNATIMNNLHEFKSRLRSPVLVGVSRKLWIQGIAKNWETTSDLDLVTAGVCCAAVSRGGNILRVHDVSLVKKVIDGYTRSTSACDTILLQQAAC